MGRKVVLSTTLLLVVACGDDAATASAGGSSSESSGDPGPTTTSSSSSSPDASSSSDEGPAPDSSSSDEGSSSTGEPPAAMPEPMGPGISAGTRNACSVADDGTMTCWGHGRCGQLGDGASVSSGPVTVAGEHTWAAVAAGDQHVCGIDSDRALWCWGDNHGAVLGDGSLPQGPPFNVACEATPLPIAAGTSWARISVSADHSCGVQTDGTAWCWGHNDHGQIGDGSLGPLYLRTEPTEVGGAWWLDVFAGSRHTCALRSDHVVECWGDGAQLGVEGLPFSSTPVEVAIDAPIVALARGGDASHTCAVDMDARVWCWGANEYGQLGDASASGVTPSLVPALGDVVEVSVRFATTCARRSNGELACFGYGGQGQLGDGIAVSQHQSPTPLTVASGTAFVSSTVGGTFACARRDDGVDLCWGANDSGQIGDGTSGPDNARLQPTIVGTWGGGAVATGWSSVAIGQHHACGARDGGALWCWGSRWAGALGNGDPLEDCNVSNIHSCFITTPSASAPGTWQTPSLGSDFGCAVRDDGTLWCWGDNGSGQLGSAVELSTVPLQIESEADWLEVDAGGSTACGIRSPGTLWCWGSDLFGQLGQGTTENDSSTPLQIGSDVDWTAVAVGDFGHVCAVRAGGELSCWGRNDYGQLGIGSDGDPVASPTTLAGAWSAIGASGTMSCAVAQDGTIWCWGGDAVLMPLQVGVDDDWQGVAVGLNEACGLRSDGTAWCWQLDDMGFTAPALVEPLDEVTSLSAGESTFCAVRSDGVAWCWGDNARGERGNDTIFVSASPTEVRDDG